MSWPILVLSYLGVASVSAGAGVGWSYLRWGRPQTVTVNEGTQMSHAPSRRVIVTVVALLLIGLGGAWLVTDRAVDQAKAQAAQDRAAEAEADAAAFARYATCLRDWGTALTVKINVARDKRAEFDAADLRRTDTFAEVFRIATKLREEPPAATDADVDRALEAFKRADARYREAYEALPDTKAAPYKAPDLTCDLSAATKETTG